MRFADLHCDLLWYLAGCDLRTAENPESNCSLGQLEEGGVGLQTLAIFTKTESASVANAEKQWALYSVLPQLHPRRFRFLDKGTIPHSAEGVHVLPAIENASGLCTETEKLDLCFARLERYQQTLGPIVYLSLTWNEENRFGGGNHSEVGLKPDGEAMLQFLSGKNIALDLSHTSEALAHEALDYIHKKHLQITPIASHSNFRSIHEHKRNLSDSIAREIFRCGGIVGLNFVKHFIGKHPEEDLLRHIEYGRSLGGQHHLCLGADFFCENDLSVPFLPVFHPTLGNSSCYPHLFKKLDAVYTAHEKELLAFRNLENYFQRTELFLPN